MLSITGILIWTKLCWGKGGKVNLFQSMETQVPAKHLMDSCEKLIFLPAMAEGVSRRYAHYICEFLPVFPITFF